MRTRSPIAMALLAAALTFAGCEKKVTLDNYNQITQGMTYAQVSHLLGGPGENETATGMSINGASLPETKESTRKVYRWKDGTKNIVVTFDKDVMFDKAQEGL